MRGSFIAISVLLLVATGCGSPSTTGSGGSGGSANSGGAGSTANTGGSGGAGGTANTGGSGGTVVADDLDMTEADFECIKDWTQVRMFFVANKLGNLQGALDVANANDGGTYPVGTVIQLVPTEAMVKRKAGFSPETNDWEFFFLGVSDAGTTIDARGTTDVVNQFGGNCFNCHAKAETKWDLICEKTHGCDPLPISDATIKNVQDSDPRCK